MIIFSQRVTDTSFQEWNSEVNSKHGFKYYKEFKSSIVVETYLECIDSYIFKKALAKFRCGVFTAKLKYQSRTAIQVDLANKDLCLWCLKQRNGKFMMDEYHMLLICPFYRQLRNNLIPKYYWLYPDYCKFVDIMSANNITVLYELA